MAVTERAGVRLAGVTKRFGGVTAVDAVSLSFDAGGFFGLLGPSGSGKTTLLRLIAGFEFPDDGTLEIGGVPVARLPVEKRQIGMVFQNYALFPNMSVAENIGFGLRVAGLNAAARAKKVATALDLVRLDGFGPRRPHQLSGGQRQRVALARAIVTDPKVLLLDEPLSALDKSLREEMQVELKRIQREIGITTVFVTHDQEEALTLSDRIGILRDGKLVEEGPPETLYAHPRSRFSAEFLGAANIFTGAPGEGILTLQDGAVLRHSGGAVPMVAVRPEHIVLGPPPDAGWNLVAARLTGRVFSGATAALRFEYEGQELRVTVPGAAPLDAALGAVLTLAFAPEHTVPLSG
ncbi:MAG: ABC transporter ATP-binding protein [Pseudomonadota bacterium]